MDLGQVIETIDETSQDSSIPGRIRKMLEKVSCDLKDNSHDTAMGVTTAIYDLEEVVDDVNIPMHAKTVLWDIISDLEAVKE